MKLKDVNLYRLHAGFCRTLASAKRLMILDLLSEKEMSVGELAREMDTPLATVSQHLGILRGKNVVEARKEGQTVYYRTMDPRLKEACLLIRTILLDGMQKRGELAAEFATESEQDK